MKDDALRDGSRQPTVDGARPSGARQAGAAPAGVFDERERAVLIGRLRRMHENLPAVEQATERYLASHHPAARRRSSAGDAE